MDKDNRYSGRDSSSSEPEYNPYEEYVNSKITDESDEILIREYSDDVPEDDRGRSYRKRNKSRATTLEKAGFALSIASLVCCCCANIYITLAVSIMALTISICSRFFSNEDHHFHSLAIAAIIISSISIAIVAFVLFFYLTIYPELINDPAYREMIEQMTRILNSGADPSAAESIPLPSGNGDTI